MATVRAFGIVLALALASITSFMIWRFAGPDRETPIAKPEHVLRLIDQARSTYRVGNLDEAEDILHWALFSIGFDNRSRYEALLPMPLVEWIPGRDNTVKSPFPYSTRKVSREYTKRITGESIQVWIGTRDGHLLYGVTDPRSAGPLDKLLRIGGAPARIKADGNVFIETDRLVVMVSGSASEADKLAFANMIDIAELAKFN